MKGKKRKIAVGICSLFLFGMTSNAQENENILKNEWVITTEEKTWNLSEEVKGAFGTILEEKIKKIGICNSKEKQNEEIGLYSPDDSETGICYTIFLDMEKDEIPEFYMLSYEQAENGTMSLNEEIYRWNGTGAELVFDEKHMVQTGKEMVTEIYHESGPIGRYQQSVTDYQQTRGFLGTLYRMNKGTMETYLSVESQNGENQIQELTLEYKDETSSYEEIPDLQMKLRGLVGGNMRSKLIAGAQDERMIYDSLCSPVIYEKNEIYAAYNDVSEIQDFLNGKKTETEIEERETESEKVTGSQTEKETAKEQQTETETIKEPETERTIMAAGHMVEPEIQQTENSQPQTQPETTGMEEMKYYLYIQSQLVPSMGLMTSTEIEVNDVGSVTSGEVSGVMSAVFNDVNEDGQKEMILSYFKNDGKNFFNQVIFELYGIENGQVVKYDDTLDYPSDKQNRLGLWENTEVYIKGKYLCLYRISASASLSSRTSDLYIYELHQNQITMIRNYQFTRVPGIIGMSEGVQQISYHSGNETEVSEEQIVQTKKKIEAELDYFGLSDLKNYVDDPIQNLNIEPVILGIKMWKSKGIIPENMMNHTIWFTDYSGLTEYVSPIQVSAAPQTETADPMSYYILPGSDSHYLSEEEINNLPINLLEYACNEIYARHGRKFVDSAFQNYFNSQPWYRGTIEPDQFNTNVFNLYETENILRLVKRMQQVGIR